MSTSWKLIPRSTLPAQDVDKLEAYPTLDGACPGCRQAGSLSHAHSTAMGLNRCLFSFLYFDRRLPGQNHDFTSGLFDLLSSRLAEAMSGHLEFLRQLALSQDF
jgi:hypothetical protein